MTQPPKPPAVQGDDWLEVVVSEAMQGGFDSAMAGSPLNTAEENENLQNKLYADAMSKAKAAIQAHADKARLEERQHTAKLTTGICTGVVTPDFAMAVSNERLAQLSHNQKGLS